MHPYLHPTVCQDKSETRCQVLLKASWKGFRGIIPSPAKLHGWSFLNGLWLEQKHKSLQKGWGWPMSCPKRGPELSCAEAGDRERAASNQATSSMLTHNSDCVPWAPFWGRPGFPHSYLHAARGLLLVPPERCLDVFPHTSLRKAGVQEISISSGLQTTPLGWTLQHHTNGAPPLAEAAGAFAPF